MSILCNPYIWESPAVLVETKILYSTNTVCFSEHVNHIVLLTLICSIIAYVSRVYLKRTDFIYASVIFALFLATPTLMAIYNMKVVKEPFKAVIEPTVSLPRARMSSASVTYPTARNPFMNVMADEIRYNPGRPPAASVMDPSVRVSLDDFFRTEFARDPTDVFGRNQSQRQFITMPSTSIPNDVESYQKWLYKIPGKTCKEGGREACLPGTDGGAIPWMNMDS